MQIAKCKIEDCHKKFHCKMKNAKCKIDRVITGLKRDICVIPAKAGIQFFKFLKICWTPVCTGVTTLYKAIQVRTKSFFNLDFAVKRVSSAQF